VRVFSANTDINEKGFNVRLTVVDTPGFADYMNNTDCWTPITEFLDIQHNDFMKKEGGTERYLIDDLRVHACLYFIQPTGHT
jgi:cell division control protein 12